MNQGDVYLLYNTNASDIQLYQGSRNKENISDDLEYEEKDEFTILYSSEDNRNYTDIKIVSRTKLKNRPRSVDSFIKKLKNNVEGVILRRTSSFSSIEELFLLKKFPLIRPLLSETEILTLQKLQKECRNQRQESDKKGAEIRRSGMLETKINPNAKDFALPNTQALDAEKLYDKQQQKTRIISPHDLGAIPYRPKTTKKEEQIDKPKTKSPKKIDRVKPESNRIRNKHQRTKINKLREALSPIKKSGLDSNDMGTSKKMKLRNKQNLILKKDNTSYGKSTIKVDKQKRKKSQISDEDNKTEQSASRSNQETSNSKQTKSTKKLRDKSEDTIILKDTRENINDDQSKQVSSMEKTPSKSRRKEKKGQRKSGIISSDSFRTSSHSNQKNLDNEEKVHQTDVQIKKQKFKKPDSTLVKSFEKSSKLSLISKEEQLKTPAEQSETAPKNKSHQEKDKKQKKSANLFQYMIQYILSDPKFVQLGWTIKPTDKSHSRLVTFRALPANPQTYFFRDRGHTETKYYGSGKAAILMELDGTGMIIYPGGSPAVIITNHEKCKRLVIYSNPKKDPLIKESFQATILGIFDSFGNADVYDLKGNKVLCYNQLEGIFNNTINNTTYKWKWNSYDALKQRQIQEILNSMVEDVKKSASSKNKKETKSADHSGSVSSKKPIMEKKTTMDRIYETVLAELPQPTAPKSPLKNNIVPTHFKSIILKINQEMTLRINGQDKAFITFLSEKCFYKIDIGVVIDPDLVESIHELKNTEVNSLPCIFSSVLHISQSLQNLHLPQ